MRRGNKIAFGDGENLRLRSAIRAHAHFAEYVPIIVIMNSFLEIGGAPAVRMHALLGTLTVLRVLHPFGMYARPLTLQFIVRHGGDDTDRAGHGGVLVAYLAALRSLIPAVWRPRLDQGEA